jgi:hypothetical protein
MFCRYSQVCITSQASPEVGPKKTTRFRFEPLSWSVGHDPHELHERLAPDSEGAMRKARFTKEQMVAMIREADRELVSAVAKRHAQRGRKRLRL